MSIEYRRRTIWGNTFLLGAFLLFMALICSVLFTSNVTYAAPGKINYQGRLTDATGAAKPDGQYNMKFRIYDAVSSGTLLWSETRETTNRVTVTNGQFSVQLGAVTPISSSVFAGDSTYFEVELPTPATATCSTAACGTFTEGAMTPRQPVSSSAYALTAEDSDTLDGLDNTSFAQVSSSNTFTGTNLFRNSTNSTTAFGVQRADSVSLFGINTADSVVTVGTGSGGSPSFGNSTFSELTTEPDSINKKFYSKYTTGSSAGSTDRISVFMQSGINSSPNNKFTMAIYSGTAGTPETLIATSAEGVLTPGWNSVPISATLAPNTAYWLGYMTNISSGTGLNAPSYGSGGQSWIANGSAYSSAFPATNAVNIPSQGTRAYAMEVYFSGGSNAALTTDKIGRVGIGTATPHATLGVAGNVQIVSNSDRAFSVLGSSSMKLFSVDSTNNRVHIGSMVTDYQSATVLVLDSSDLAGDPTGKNGAMYYNTVSNKFRCYQDSAWQNCISIQMSKMPSDVATTGASNVLQNATGLSFFAVAGQTYNFSALINYTSSATANGSRWTITGPASPTNLAYQSTYALTASTVTTNFVSAYNAPASFNATSAVTTGNIAQIDGIITPSVDGNVQVQFASEGAAGTITAKAGSSIRWW